MTECVNGFNKCYKSINQGFRKVKSCYQCQDSHSDQASVQYNNVVWHLQPLTCVTTVNRQALHKLLFWTRAAGAVSIESCSLGFPDFVRLCVLFLNTFHTLFSLNRWVRLSDVTVVKTPCLSECFYPVLPRKLNPPEAFLFSLSPVQSSFTLFLFQKERTLEENRCASLLKWSFNYLQKLPVRDSGPSTTNTLHMYTTKRCTMITKTTAKRWKTTKKRL